jgi:hypothetical protein
MRGKRNARSRVRGSWAARLTGAGLAVLLAGAGVVTYLVVDGNHANQDGSELPTRVLSTQAVGLVNPGPAGAASASAASDMLLATGAGLSFSDNSQAGSNWTADQMAGGTIIFIYLPDGHCLGPSRGAGLSLQRCNLQAGQRWLQRHPVTGASGLQYWQLRNLSDGRCLTAAGTGSGATSARLEHCQASPGWQQLIALLTAS